MYRLRFDGACRNNPGLCGAGFVIDMIVGDQVEEVDQQSHFISPHNTNNFAEYTALRLGIERALELEIQDILVEGDSLLAINQINGLYKVKSLNIKPIYENIIESLKKFERYTFQHIKRDKNSIADSLANKAIDEYLMSNQI
jgi:ribonuclease HI